MKSSSFARCCAGVVLLGIPLLSTSAWAQDTVAPPVADAKSPAVVNPADPDFFESLKPVAVESMMPSPAPYGVEFPVHNVSASLIAYWLDPAHQPTPIGIRVSEMLSGGMSPISFATQVPSGKMEQPEPSPRLPGNGKGPKGVKLPEGVSRIIALDPQNKILAFGTKEGLRAFNDLLPTLDVPLVQYEIEAQFLSVARADVGKLGVDFGNQPHQGPYSFGAVAMVGNVPNNPGAMVGYVGGPIAKLIMEGRIKILTAPRVTAIDGLTAELQQTTSTPFILTTFPGTKPTAGTQTQQSVAYLTTSIGLRATAVRIKEDLISLSVTPTLTTRSLSVNAIVRDGESFAIQMSPAKDDNQVVVIVTTRVIRRAK